MNWSECSLVEIVPGKLSGTLVIMHSRVRPDDLVANCDEGQEWLAENHSLPLQAVREILAFYERTMGPALNPV